LRPSDLRDAAQARAVALYPTTAVRDIACELDVSVNFVQHAAKKAGLPARPASQAPA
jgi:hypothetical protein